MTKLVILMAGAARSGKDTVTDMLFEKLTAQGHHVVKSFFAKSLKTSLQKAFALTDEQIFGDLKETPFPLYMGGDLFERVYVATLHELHHGSLMSVDLHMKNQTIHDTAADITGAMISTIKKKAVYLGNETCEVSPRQLMQWWGTEAVRMATYEDAWVDCVEFDLKSEQAEIGLISDARFDNEPVKIRAAFPDCPVVIVKVERGNKPTVAAHISEAGVSDYLIDFTIKNDDTLDALSKKADTLINCLI